MTTKEIEMIVRYVMQETWKTQLLIGLIIAIVAFIGSYLGSYLKKKAENFATKEDFKEILNQLKTQVTATEQIKSEISHSNWVNQEWKTLRRIKLEELITAIYEASEWLSKDQSIRLFNSEPNNEDASHIWNIEMISRLYFPELVKEINEFKSIYYQYNAMTLKTECELLKAGTNSSQRQTVFDKNLPIIQNYIVQIKHTTIAIEQKAPSIMEKIVGIKTQ